MLTLEQNQSNLLYWCKNWYENANHKTFWPQLKILHEDYTGCEGGIAELYWYVRELWKKIVKSSGNEEFLVERYENETLPEQARYYRGSPNHEECRNWNRAFSGEEMIMARIAVMVSQIKLTQTKYYNSEFPTDLEGLVISEDKKEKLKQMLDNRNE